MTHVPGLRTAAPAALLAPSLAGCSADDAAERGAAAGRAAAVERHRPPRGRRHARAGLPRRRVRRAPAAGADPPRPAQAARDLDAVVAPRAAGAAPRPVRARDARCRSRPRRRRRTTAASTAPTCGCSTWSCPRPTCGCWSIPSSISNSSRPTTAASRALRVDEPASPCSTCARAPSGACIDLPAGSCVDGAHWLDERARRRARRRARARRPAAGRLPGGHRRRERRALRRSRRRAGGSARGPGRPRSSVPGRAACRPSRRAARNAARAYAARTTMAMPCPPPMHAEATPTDFLPLCAARPAACARAACRSRRAGGRARSRRR